MSKLIPSRKKSGEVQNSRRSGELQTDTGQLSSFYYYPEEHKSTFKKIISDRIFWLTVLIPTIIAIIYYTFIASGIYISESKFIVRAQSKESPSALPSSLSCVLVSIGGSLGGLSTSQNDSLAAENYITSRDALNILDKDLDIINTYSSTAIDILHRFGGVRFWDKSKEAFYDYYREHIVGVGHDSDSGIAALTVRAFDADTAYAINTKLNEISEGLINRLNDRARKEMLSFSENEVELAKRRLEQVNQKIFDYRNRDTQGNGSANRQITYYQQLASEKEFADRNLATALASMEQARIEAMKKRLYLEKVSEPNKPDIAMEPRRIRGILTAFFFGILIWGIISMLASGIREHHQ
jgi:capsular polysaccharide transport system permease protein